jgi:acetyltransferase-like isoleucine patch superfamily enzyme
VLPDDVLAARVARFVGKELRALEPRKVFAATIGMMLPPFTWNITRTLIWRASGMQVGDRTRICGALHITGSKDWHRRVHIGSDVMISGPLRMDVEAQIEIGNRVQIGHDVMLLTINHEIGTPEQRCGEHRAAAISIGDGAWLASRVVVLPGVRIGRGSIVGAGAVVTRDVPDHCLAAGVPARLVRRLDGAGEETRTGWLDESSDTNSAG